MRKYSFLVLLTAFSSLFAQENKVEYYELSSLPWNADWLSERDDVLVSGEGYHGYPGPLAKYFHYLGQDPQHPSLQYEWLNNVDRDAPYWYGSCNGWAAAATLLPEPVPAVLNGVKFNAADMKALLTMIWKDNIEIHVAGENGVGMSAKDFERVLFDFIASDRPIIFDVTLGQESWNFPVASFRRETQDDGTYINIETEVFYVSTLPMSQVDRFYGTDITLYPIKYTYRFLKGTENYEWTGTSVDEQPQRAWYAVLPHLEGTWFRRSNRFVNMSDIRRMELEHAEGHIGNYDDRYEPNNQPANAAKVDDSLTMGALPVTDVDYYEYNIRDAETFALNFRVYSGSGIDLIFYNAQGDAIKVVEGITEAYQYLPEGHTGALRVKVTPWKDAPTENEVVDHGTIFYWIQRPRDRSWIKMPVTKNAGGEQALRVINLASGNNHLIQSPLQVLPASGSVALPAVEGTLYETSEKASWAYEKSGPNGRFRHYLNSQPGHSGYKIPHLSFVNGWNTLLDFTRLYPNDAVSIQVYGQNGALIQTATLPNPSNSDVIDLSSVLQQTSKSSGLWFQLTTTARNVLLGTVRYENQSGAAFELDLDLPAVNGENYFVGLHATAEGNDYLCMVNTSGQSNEVLYRLLDASGRKKLEGGFFLESGQKWLGSVASLVNGTVAKGDQLALFSQYNLSLYRLDLDSRNGMLTAVPPFSKPLDLIQEATIARPQLGATDSKLVVANIVNQFNRILLQGYDERGQQLNSLSVTGSRSIGPQEVLQISLAELLQSSGESAETLARIKYFKLSTQRPVFIYELDQDAGKTWQKHVRIHPIRQSP